MSDLTIIKRSHHFVVTRLTEKGKAATEGFARQYIQWGRERRGFRYVTAALKVFAAATHDRKEYRFHINCFKLFEEHLAQNFLTGDSVTVIEESPPPFEEIDVKVFDTWEVLDYQKPVIDYILDEKGPKSKFVDLQTGKGKLQKLSSKIKVPGGWSTMGEMYVGKTITAWDGTPCQVTAIHPNGQQQLYKVTFYDGRSTEVGADHLWRVYYVNTVKHRRWRIVDTMEVLRLISMPNPRVYVQLCESEEGSDIDLPVHPYLLGVMLGDGCITSGQMSFTTMDQEIVDRVAQVVPEGIRIFERKDNRTNGKARSYGLSKVVPTDQNILRQKFLELNLLEKQSHEKFVPEIYLHASTEQRWELLRGLMDTDGTIQTFETGNSSGFCTTSEKLAKNVQYLVRSLGGMAKIALKQPYYTHKGERKEGRIAYIVNIRMKTPSKLFNLSRKKERANDNNQYAADLKLQVKSVVPTTIEETRCISIDHPDRLYVTDDFIVTHNSFCAMQSISLMKTRAVYIVKAMYLEKWVIDIRKTYDIAVEDLMVIRGSNQLMALLQMAMTGQLDFKVVLLSNKTMQNWIKLYEKHGEGTLDMGYACTPDRFFEVLQAGIRVIDEVHQDFHLNFKIDLYTNVSKSLSLSATLLADDPFLNRMYELAYPKEDRYKGPAYDKYISSTAYCFNFNEPNRIRTKDPASKNYSHHLFEQSLVRQPEVCSNFLEMINRVLKLKYFDIKDEGEKAIIFCASIEMCSIVTDFLRKKYPHMDVRRYVEEDPYENLMEADIRVTTLLSAGTAVDIPMLRTTILTTAVSSSQSNIQGFGRLRKMASGNIPEFVYFVGVDIPKHVEYHEKKRTMIGERSVAYATTYHNSML